MSRPARMTPLDWEVYRFINYWWINNHAPPPVSAIAERHLTVQSNVHRIFRKLEKFGYITLVRDGSHHVKPVPKWVSEAINNVSANIETWNVD